MVLKMTEEIEQWSIEKAIACLKRIIHPEVLPPISQEELIRMKYADVFLFGNEKLYIFLMLLYERSKGKLEIYGTINEMIESLRKVSRIPEFTKFSSTPGIKVSSECALFTQYLSYFDIDDTMYLSQSDIAISVYAHVTSTINKIEMIELTYAIFQTWQTTRLNKILQGYEKSYNLIPFDSRKPFIDACNKFRETGLNIKIPEESVTFESFSKLREYFDPNYVKFFDVILEYIKDEMRDVKKQECMKKAYAQLVFLIENIKKIYDEHAGIFELSSEVKKTPSMDYKPVIRFLKNRTSKHYYYLSKEIKNAIQKLMLTNKSRKKCEDLIIVESDEERKNGIVYATRPSEFKELLEELNCDHDRLTVFTGTLEEDYQNMALPIISSYGTHCVIALEAFGRIVYYLAVNLKVFQRSKGETHQKVLDWIDEIMDSFFVEKSVLYLIEILKIDEIYEKARTDLFPLLTDKPEFEVPFQKTYIRNDVYRALLKLFENFAWKSDWYNETSKTIINKMPPKNITIKNIYNGYSEMVLLYLKEYRQKVKDFNKNQSGCTDPNSPKTAQSGGESKQFIQFRKGDLYKSRASSKKQEPKEQENMPSCSTENAGNRDQQVGEELERLEIEKNKIGKLEQEKARLKTVNEDSEKEIKKLRKELEKSQKSKAHLEKTMKDMISQLNTLTVNFQKQIQKPREDLETATTSTT